MDKKNRYKIRHPDNKDNKKFRIIIGILVMIILLCLGYVAWLFYGYYKTDSLYDSVMDEYVAIPVEIEDDLTTLSPEDDGFPDRDIDMEGLIKSNPDFLCWLYYEDGGVDYPVVKEQEDDINGWMYRAFDGSKSSSGTIFMPYDADSGFHDMNTFLYGHNMANGSILGSMKFVYRNPAEKYKDPYFYIWTKDYEKIKYRIVSMYVVNKDSSMYAVPMSKDGYQDYFSMMMKAGSMSGFIEFSETEMDAVESCSPIVTLSTCYGYAGTSNRLLVQGVEIDRRPYVKNTESTLLITEK